MPDEKIVLEGFLMRTPKTVEGGGASCLQISKNPIIVQGGGGEGETPSEEFVFREVNFVAQDTQALFVLQNRRGDISMVFEDCHFSSEG